VITPLYSDMFNVAFSNGLRWQNVLLAYNHGMQALLILVTLVNIQLNF